ACARKVVAAIADRNTRTHWICRDFLDPIGSLDPGASGAAANGNTRFASRRPNGRAFCRADSGAIFRRPVADRGAPTRAGLLRTVAAHRATARRVGVPCRRSQAALGIRARTGPFAPRRRVDLFLVRLGAGAVFPAAVVLVAETTSGVVSGVSCRCRGGWSRGAR